MSPPHQAIRTSGIFEKIAYDIFNDLKINMVNQYMFVKFYEISLEIWKQKLDQTIEIENTSNALEK